LAANQAYYDAFEALDFERMARVWSEEAPLSCVHPAWELIEGRAEVLASWRRIFASTSSIRFGLRDVHVYVAGETAWVVLIEQIETRHGDERVAASAQATNVFVREPDGWRLVHHHSAPIRLPAELPLPEKEKEKTMLN
jgi:ketosteroid isomerase-like protein